MAIRKLKPTPGQRHAVRHAVAGEPGGLYIQITPNGSKSWLLRVTTGTRPHRTKAGVVVQIRREFGLGSYPVIGLQAARERALQYLAKTTQGVDPVAEKRAVLEAAHLAQSKRKMLISTQN